MDDPGDRPIPDLEALYADREPPLLHEERAAELFRTAAAEWWPQRRVAREQSTSHSRGPGRSRLFRIAAGVVLFSAGFAAARVLVHAPTTDTAATSDSAGPAAGELAVPATRSYMLLLWERPGFAADVPPGRLAREYSEWARVIAATGVAITGHELAAERNVVRGNIAAAHDAVGERVGGFFIVSAPDMATARRIADGHPHIGYGGWIEIAEVL